MVLGLFDPWGRPYRVVIDGDGDEQPADPFGRESIDGRRVLAYSLGKNGCDESGGGVPGTTSAGNRENSIISGSESMGE